MKPLATLLCTLLLSLLSTLAYANGLVASVDRNRLSLDDTLDLILETPDANLYGKPDLTPLEPLFHILGTRQVNRLSTVQGQTSVLTRWIITLQPRNQGFIVIPPLKVGDQESQSISIQVTEPSAAQSGQAAPIYIETTLDQDSLYVQEQALLTLRIFHSVSLYDDSSLTPPQVKDARVEQLGDARTYEQLVNGVRHGVIEVRYAITPLKSGELDIPAQVFSATPALRNSGINPFGARPGSPTRVHSSPLNLTVKPIPASYPSDATWLPARSLTLSETLSPEASEIKVGDSLTRTLTITASGLSSAQLPDLPQTQIEGLRNYPDQPRLSNRVDEFGLLGSREESEALVATETGSFELPAVELYWWNTETDQLETARIAARRLEVISNPELVESVDGRGEQTNIPREHTLWPWQAAVAALILSNLLWIILWWRARRQPAIQRNQSSGPSTRTLLDELKRACLANDSSASRQAIDAWARQQPETLAEMAARYQPLSEALHGLNEALYSENSQLWEGNALWQAVRTLPDAQTSLQSAQETSPLPPLYPR